MTLERANGFITNRDNERAGTMLSDLRAQFKDDPEISRQLETLAAQYRLLLEHRASESEIQAIAERMRRRYQAVGGALP